MERRGQGEGGYTPQQYAAAQVQQARNNYAMQTAHAAQQANAMVAAHQAQAAQFTQAAYHAQAAAHAASQYGGLEAQNAYQNAQQWSNMAQASLMHLHAAQQAATKASDVANAAQASAEGFNPYTNNGAYGSK